MMIIDAEYFSKSVWGSKLKRILLDNNLRDMFSGLTEVSTKTDLPWSKVSSATTESNCSYHLELQDIESREKEREREDQLEDALLVQTSNPSHSPSSRRETKKSKGWPTTLKTEDLDPREQAESENSMVLKRLKVKRPAKAHVPSSKRTPLEEHSKAKRMLRPLDTKPPRFKDLLLRQDWEERESPKLIKLENGKDL